MNERFNIFYTFWQNGCYDNMTQAILKIFKLKVAQLNFVESYKHQSLLITQTKVRNKNKATNYALSLPCQNW